MRSLSPATTLPLLLLLLLYAFPTVLAHPSQPQQNHHPSLQNPDRARIIQRQEEGNPPSTPPTPTIGLFSPPSLLAGPLGTGNGSLTGGHGPAIQPQPGASSPFPSDNGTGLNATSAYSNNNRTLTSTSDSSLTNTLPPSDLLAVTTRQYITTSHSLPRVDITLTYGSQRVTQTWEVRADGTIRLVPDMRVNGTDPLCGVGVGVGGNGTGGGGGLVAPWRGNGTRDGAGATMCSSGLGIRTGTATPALRRERSGGARPGFTGPKVRVRERG